MTPAWNRYELARFWDYIAERQAIWHRRFVLQLPAPWTKDPFLSRWHMTNVYRELDPGTRHLVGVLVANHSAPAAEKLLNALAYRYGLTERGQEALGWLRLEPGMPGRAGEVAARTQGFWTPAYMVRPFLARQTKAEGFAALLQAWKGEARRLGQLMRESRSREDFVTGAQALPAIGPFLAYQVLVDLCYEPVQALPWGNDGWALCGPGARKGLGVLWGEEVNPYGSDGPAFQDGLTELCDMQRGELELRGFTPWKEGDRRDGWLTRANLQNCLCEFYKLVSLSNGGRPNCRRYRP